MTVKRPAYCPSCGRNETKHVGPYCSECGYPLRPSDLGGFEEAYRLEAEERVQNDGA